MLFERRKETNGRLEKLYREMNGHPMRQINDEREQAQREKT